MKKYYRISPRGFANEDTIISASNPAEIEYCENLIVRMNNDPNAWGERITRKEAEHITAANRAAYRRGGANSNNPAGATDILSTEDYRLWGEIQENEY